MENKELEDSWKKALEGAEEAPSPRVWSGIESELIAAETNAGPVNHWRSALEGAETMPSESVWNGVEADLIAAENVSMRRAVVRYQRIAAAAVLVAFVAGAYSIFYKPERGMLVSKLSPPDSIVRQQQVVKPTDESARPAIKPSTADGQNEPMAETEPAVMPVIENKKALSDHAAVDTGVKNEQRLTSAAVALDKRSTVDKLGSSDPDYSLQAEPIRPGTPLLPVQKSILTESLDFALSHAKKLPQNKDAAEPAEVAAGTTGPGNLEKSEMNEIVLKTSLASDDSLRKAIAAAESPLRVKPQETVALPWQEEQPGVVIKKNDKKENTWASVGAAAGVFNPGVKGSATQNATSGPAYSFGASVAGRILPKWVLQGGVSYINQSTGESQMASPVANTNLASSGITDYNLALHVAEVSASAPISTVEFISVPVQAGYMLVDHKVGFLINAGIASNFFVKNSLQDQSGHVSTFSSTDIDQTPYKRVTMSGLMSTELSYRVARQYRIAFVPGIRYALGSTMKQVSDRPYIMDLGLRVRYNF